MSDSIFDEKRREDIEAIFLANPAVAAEIYDDMIHRRDILENRVYLRLFHGRDELDQDMDDEKGFEGPTFGPCLFIQTVYGASLILGELKNATSEKGVHMMHLADDCLYYDGKFYGDWTVTDKYVVKRDGLEVAEFDQELADIPAEVKRKLK